MPCGIQQILPIFRNTHQKGRILSPFLNGTPALIRFCFVALPWFFCDSILNSDLSMQIIDDVSGRVEQDNPLPSKHNIF